MSKISLIHLFVTAFGFSAYAGGLATDSLHSKPLSEVVVNGRRSQNVRAAMPVQQFDQAELKQLNATNVADVAKHFSGVSVKDYGGIGGLKTVSLRGFCAQHTGVSYDGVMVSDIQTGQIDLGKFSLENIANISLSNAQPNDIFQSARMFASAGVISLTSTTLLPDSIAATTGKATIKTGSFGLLNGSFIVYKPAGKRWQFNLSGDGTVANGQYSFLSNLDPANPNGAKQELTRKNSDVQSARVEANSRFNFTSKKFIAAKINLYTSERGLPESVILYNDYSAMRLWDKQLFSQLNYQNRNSEKFQHQFLAKYSYNDTRFVDASNRYGSSEAFAENYHQHEYYLSGTLLYRPIQPLTFSTAVDGWYNNLDVSRTNGYERSNNFDRTTALATFVTKYTSERATIGANILYTHTQENAKTGNTAANRDKFSPTVSLSLKVLNQEDLRVRVFYKNIFRVPTFNELYFQDMGNKNLNPESTNQYNVGIVYRTTKSHLFSELEFSIDGYYNQVDNKIIAIPKGLFHWTFVNKGKVEIKGIDATALASVSLGKSDIITGRANYTYQKATDALTTSANFGEQIPYTPFHSGSGSLVWVHRTVEVGYNLLYSGKRWDGQNRIENVVKSFTEHSVFASISKKRFKITGELINLLNTSYEVVRFYPMPRRNFRITASYEF